METIQPSSDPRLSSRWSVYLALGYKTRIHTAEDFKAGMTAAGYVDGHSTGIPGWTTGSYVASPSGLSHGGAIQLAAGYDKSDQLGYRFFFNKGDFVDAQGQRYDSTTTEYDHIAASGSLMSVGALMTYRLAPALRLGVGPSFHYFGVDYVSSIGDEVTTDSLAHLTAGLTLEGLLTVPAYSTIFVFTGYQRHLILGFDIGPFADMPATQTSISHSMWMFGMGFRL